MFTYLALLRADEGGRTFTKLCLTCKLGKEHFHTFKTPGLKKVRLKLLHDRQIRQKVRPASNSELETSFTPSHFTLISSLNFQASASPSHPQLNHLLPSSNNMRSC